MPNNASTKYGSSCKSEKQCAGTSRHTDLTMSHSAKRNLTSYTTLDARLRRRSATLKDNATTDSLATGA